MDFDIQSFFYGVITGGIVAKLLEVRGLKELSPKLSQRGI